MADDGKMQTIPFDPRFPNQVWSIETKRFPNFDFETGSFPYWESDNIFQVATISFLRYHCASISIPKQEVINISIVFSNQNQTRNCWQNYVDFHRCQKIKVSSRLQLQLCLKIQLDLWSQGEEYEPCKFFEKNFRTVCPAAWIEKWDEQRDKVRFKLVWRILYYLFFRAPSLPTSRAPLLRVVYFNPWIRKSRKYC